MYLNHLYFYIYITMFYYKNQNGAFYSTNVELDEEQMKWMNVFSIDIDEYEKLSSNKIKFSFKMKPNSEKTIILKVRFKNF